MRERVPQAAKIERVTEAKASSNEGRMMHCEGCCRPIVDHSRVRVAWTVGPFFQGRRHAHWVCLLHEGECMAAFAAITKNGSIGRYKDVASVSLTSFLGDGDRVAKLRLYNRFEANDLRTLRAIDAMRAGRAEAAPPTWIEKFRRLVRWKVA